MPNIISHTAAISKMADIEESVKGSKLIIKDYCIIDAFVKIKFSGGVGDIEIGERCYINSGCVIYSGHGLKIGNKVLIASNCTLVPANHGMARYKPILEQAPMPSKGGIIIEDDVWIGANCVILDGVHIPLGVIIGAGSIVKPNDKLEPYGIYGGKDLSCIRFRT
jgi:virginiamycin A acetyltransferase